MWVNELSGDRYRSTRKLLLMAVILTFPRHGYQYTSLCTVANAYYQIPYFSTPFKVKKKEKKKKLGKKSSIVLQDDVSALN